MKQRGHSGPCVSYTAPFNVISVLKAIYHNDSRSEKEFLRHKTSSSVVKSHRQYRQCWFILETEINQCLRRSPDDPSYIRFPGSTVCWADALIIAQDLLIISILYGR